MRVALAFGAFALMVAACDADGLGVLRVGDGDSVRDTTRQIEARQEVWTYRNPQGRVVFVGGESMVPPEHRTEARPLDLSHVSLNQELGSEWNQTIEREHRRLATTDFCAEAVDASSAGPVALAQREHGHLIGIGGVILALLLASPWIARKVGGARWLRTLLFVVPILLLLALLTHVAVRSSEAMAEVRETADLCDPDRPDLATTSGAQARAGVVQRLVARIRQAEERRLQAIDAQLEAARE